MRSGISKASWVFLGWLTLLACSGGQVDPGSRAENGAGDTSVGGSAGKGGSGGAGGGHHAGAGATTNGGKAGGGSQSGGSSSGGKAGDGGSDGGSNNVAGDAGTAGSGGSLPIGSVSYKTSFDTKELPISEQGKWHKAGLDWTDVETDDGIAFGTQKGTGAFDDSYAMLADFPADQWAEGVVHRDAAIDTGCTHEVELLLRWSDGAHEAKGYEVNLAYDGAYTEIVRWNGAVGSFDYLERSNVPGGVHDGDVLRASIQGEEIVVTLNGKELNRATDATFKSGNPGIGFWRGGMCGTRGDYGFTEFSASSID